MAIYCYLKGKIIKNRIFGNFGFGTSTRDNRCNGLWNVLSRPLNFNNSPAMQSALAQRRVEVRDPTQMCGVVSSVLCQEFFEVRRRVLRPPNQRARTIREKNSVGFHGEVRKYPNRYETSLATCCHLSWRSRWDHRLEA